MIGDSMSTDLKNGNETFDYESGKKFWESKINFEFFRNIENNNSSTFYRHINCKNYAISNT